jgi:flavin reductase (DIM6/NTAB) family NADH-FMN oxidoreductase RutF
MVVIPFWFGFVGDYYTLSVGQASIVQCDGKKEKDMKRGLLLNQAKWLVEPGCVVLVSAGTMQKANVMTISWQTPVHTADPCLVLLVMHQGRYTYELIRQNKELVINVPGANLLEQTHLVGTVSGRKIDKFKEAGLTPVPAKLVQPPLVDECAGHLECQVIETFTVKTHDLLICEVIYASVEEDLFDGAWIPEKFHTLHYMSATQYGLLGRRIAATGDC